MMTNYQRRVVRPRPVFMHTSFTNAGLMIATYSPDGVRRGDDLRDIYRLADGWYWQDAMSQFEPVGPFDTEAKALEEAFK